MSVQRRQGLVIQQLQALSSGAGAAEAIRRIKDCRISVAPMRNVLLALCMGQHCGLMYCLWLVWGCYRLVSLGSAEMVHLCVHRHLPGYVTIGSEASEQA
jgi:fatty acid desaturase